MNLSGKASTLSCSGLQGRALSVTIETDTGCGCRLQTSVLSASVLLSSFVTRGCRILSQAVLWFEERASLGAGEEQRERLSSRLPAEQGALQGPQSQHPRLQPEPKVGSSPAKPPRCPCPMLFLG